MAPKDGTREAHYEWTLDSVVLAGEVVLPDGKLGVGDPAWSFEGLSPELRIAPGTYPSTLRSLARCLRTHKCAVTAPSPSCASMNPAWCRSGSWCRRRCAPASEAVFGPRAGPASARPRCLRVGLRS